MGTDISCYVETKGEDGWELAEPLVQNRFWSADYQEEPRMVPQRLFDARNYSLFAVMAGVHSTTRALEPLRCIAPPRGLPDDASAELHAHYDSWREHVHHASWLLATELLAFEWDQAIRRRGVVDRRAAHLFPPEGIGFPTEGWPKGVVMAVAHDGRGKEVTWTETYRQAVGSWFFEETLPKLAGYGPADSVRVVFWFDS